MGSLTIRQLLGFTGAGSCMQFSSSPRFGPQSFSFINSGGFQRFGNFGDHQNLIAVSKATSGITPFNEDDDGVSLGTMKLPSDTDIPRFETLLFQWANSLCQGANLPLPVPLKIDKIAGGVRLGFITIGDGSTEVLVHIDCLVFPPDDDSSVPIFRAIRNGPMKDEPPPGEPRIMKSLLAALRKSVEIARV